MIHFNNKTIDCMTVVEKAKLRAWSMKFMTKQNLEAKEASG